MKWIQNRKVPHPEYIAHIDNVSYKVIFFSNSLFTSKLFNCWCSIFFSDYNSAKPGEYITKSIKTDLYTNTGIHEEHKFATKKEAQEACERHYKLLLLQ